MLFLDAPSIADNIVAICTAIAGVLTALAIVLKLVLQIAQQIQRNTQTIIDLHAKMQSSSPKVLLPDNSDM
jgi:hypothetical protein